MGVQVHVKGVTTISNLLVAPKDKDKFTKKGGVIYKFKCVQADFEEECMRESARTFGEGSRNISILPTPSMTKVTPQVITSVWTISL